MRIAQRLALALVGFAVRQLPYRLKSALRTAALGLCSGVLVVFGAASNTGCMLCEQHGPCFDWLRLGDSYDVELVQHLGLELFEWPPFPFASVPSGPHTCGGGFDLDEGETVRLVAESRSDPPSGDDQCIDCYYVRARPEVEGVVFADGAQYEAGGLGGPQFVGGRRATIGACNGIYQIGIAPVWGAFRAMSNAYVATDFVLYRQFRTMSPQPCLVPGSELVEGGGFCWDAWAVRIRNPSGELITKDIEPPAGDAGL